MSSNTILRIPQTSKKTGLSRSTIYSLLSRGEFPKPIKLSIRTVGFLESEVDQWLADRAANCAAYLGIMTAKATPETQQKINAS